MVKCRSMSTQPMNTDSRVDYYPLVAVICLFIVVLLRCAWLCDDAFITFRTVENFWNGYGLTWNIDERVQTYTHPLWMFLLAGAYGVTREFYFSSIALGVVFTLASIWLYTTRIAEGAVSALVGVSLFVVSKAFVDFSTSGLENPLTHLLLLAFMFVAVRKPDERRSFLWLCFSAALLMLTRMDLALFVFPTLAVRCIRHFGWKAIGGALLAFAPFILWELFALFYYGSPFPNTAYAKLNTTLPADAIMWRGMQYFLSNLTTDPLTIVVILIGVLSPFVMKHRRLIPIAIGSALYLLYVMRIGGDYMLGRFLTAPFLVGVVALTHVRLPRWTGYCVLAIALVAGLAMRRSSLLSDVDYGFGKTLFDEHLICDERAYYYHGTGLLRIPVNQKKICHLFVESANDVHERRLTLCSSIVIGMFGFSVGPAVHVIDIVALGDPLLARLKPLEQDQWRPGHFYHGLPVGYQETLATGQNVIENPGIAEFYEHLRLVTRGALWDVERLRTIVNMNLGRYDHLIRNATPAYEEPHHLYPPADAVRDPLSL